MDAGGRRRREQAVEDACSRPDAALPPASMQARARGIQREPALSQINDLSARLTGGQAQAGWRHGQVIGFRGAAPAA